MSDETRSDGFWDAEAREVLARFWPKVDLPGETDGCWTWIAARDRKGYGEFWDGRRVQRAHRFAYETFVGLIPGGLQLDHLCRNPSCVNPTHLEAVTSAENTRRGKSGTPQKSRTHCPKGHAYDEANTFVNADDGKRRCRACRRERDRRRYHRMKGRVA